LWAVLHDLHLQVGVHALHCIGKGLPAACRHWQLWGIGRVFVNQC
jgi:hypothetical protein